VTTHILNVDIDYLVKEYLSGTPAYHIARQLGISGQVVLRRLREAGISIRDPRIKHVPTDNILALYQSGMSCNQVAKTFGVSRRLIEARLNAYGVVIRGRSQAEGLKWQRMGPAQRHRQTQAAHWAVLGTKHTWIQLCQRAERKFLRQRPDSPLEIRLHDWLEERGLDTTYHLNIGPYNADLAAAPVAIEVFGGNWHFSGHHLAKTEKRFRYLMEQGWHILCVCHMAQRPMTIETAHYVAAYVHTLRRNPPTVCEYRVIRGAGETLAAGSVYDEQISIIPTLKNVRDPRTGRYQSVPR
jgi:hypothetical protein